MFEPETLGLRSSQLQQFAATLVTPTLGFLFLYLLALPLKKLPFVEIAEDYKPPAWVLPLFALGSLLSLSILASAAFFLNFLDSSPVTSSFLDSFWWVGSIDHSDSGDQLEEASFTVDEYDGLSNFRIVVNGYRIFGSSSDCLLSYQCKPPLDKYRTEYNRARALQITDNSIHHVHSFNSLPYTRAIGDYLVYGRNFIDLFSENSGFGDCRLDVNFSFSFASKNIYYQVKIVPDVGKLTTERFGTKTVTTLHAYGETSDHDERIPIYGTLSAEATNRVCERVRLWLDLEESSPTKEPNIPSPVWLQSIFERHRQTLCEIVNNARPYCPKTRS